MHSSKRLLFLVHRWLGVGMCAFFAMWFISGVVMMYVGYPKLTPGERLAHLPALDAAAPYLRPDAALAAAGIQGDLQDLRLATASRGRAVYLVVPSREDSAMQGRRRPTPGAGTVVIDAQSGRVLGDVAEADAMAAAAVFAGRLPVAMSYQGAIDEDAFTHSRGLDAHRPLHVVQLGDAERTLLYISGKTGEVVRDAPRAERLWNYAGAWIHWLYPFRGNFFDRWWTDIVNWLSIVGIALTITGTVVGVMRWRFTRRYKSGARTPYRGAMMKWHHITGLLFALITFTWIFSGLMSMNPWRVLDSGAPPLRTAAMSTGKLQAEALTASPQALLATAGDNVRELRWSRSVGVDLVVANGPAGRFALMDAATAAPRLLDRAVVEDGAARLVDAPVAQTELLTAYDLHYYNRDAHTMTGGTEKPLPVLRVRFADAHETWVHIDPVTGAILGQSDSTRRLGRWLFAMLHSWDWLPLLDRRPLWDIVLIVLSAGGAALSITGIVIGWRRVGRKLGVK